MQPASPGSHTPTTPPTSATPTTPATLTPVRPGERIVALDVLRGVALFGVLAANIWIWFSGIYFRFPSYMDEVWTLSADSLAFHFVALFISGKAITTFSLLFGIGFAIQMMRAEARGRSIVGHHARRLGILLLFGALHAVFIWYGDILTAYALLGFGLLLFRKRRDKTLLTWAVLLIAVVPTVMSAVPLVMSVFYPGGGSESGGGLADLAQRNTELLALFASAEPGQIVRGNLAMLQRQWLSPKSFFLLVLFGIFLLGLFTGRSRLLETPAAHRPLLRRLVVYGFPLGFTASLAGLWLRSFPPEEATTLPWMPLASTVAATLGTIPLALAYIATVTLLLERERWRRPLSAFAPVGRMALTNYLAQSVICVAIYYWGGLVGQAGPLLGLVLAVAIFGAQMVGSAWWLVRFRFGPMEWLWRSLTYGRLQPMRLAPSPPSQAEPA